MMALRQAGPAAARGMPLCMQSGSDLSIQVRKTLDRFATSPKRQPAGTVSHTSQAMCCRQAIAQQSPRGRRWSGGFALIPDPVKHEEAE